MLSSFASFLPSALHLNQSTELPRQTVNPDTEDEDEPDAIPPRQSVEEGQQPGKGKEKDKTANETFIFVRPPPAKSNHPLNLQVQLVPPNAKPPTGVVSTSTVDATTPTSARSSSSSDGASLGRSSSGRSSSSFSNTYSSSTASFTSVASSTASSRRAIIPLYNLQAHNVMTNVIVDAGTDAKIAKFQKRGIELIDLAFLEPVEVWGEKDKEKDARRESMRISVDEMGAIMTNVSSRGSMLSARGGTFLQPGGGGSRPVTPSATSSAASLHSHSHSNLRAAAISNASAQAPAANVPAGRNHKPQPPLPDSNAQSAAAPTAASAPLPPNPPPKRNIFNKLFKKSSSSSSAATSPPSSATVTPGAGNSETGSADSFGAFSLHPAPVASKIFARDAEKRAGGRGTPPPPPLPLPLLQPPLSPASTTSQQTTPTQPQTPRASARQETPVSPTTPTVAPPPKEKQMEREREREKGHARNSSLTAAITTPFKTTLRTNKNRLSAVINSGGSSGATPSGLGLAVEEGLGARDRDRDRKRDVSPNPSMARSSRSQLSLVGSAGAGSAESHGGGGGGGGGGSHQIYPLMLTQSQAREELSNLKQQQLHLRPPILGIQPSFVSSASTPSNASAAGMASPLVAALSPRMSDNPENLLQGQRALMYVWLVRKWLKRRPSVFGDAGLFSGLTAGGKGGAGGGPAPLPYGGVEVRFEWKRARGKEGRGGKKSRRGRRSTGRGDLGSVDNGAESDGGGGGAGSVRDRDRTRERDDRGKERLKAEEKRAKRMSTGSYSTTTASSEGAGESVGAARKLRREGTVDDGGDSDPEDSETPWVCTLKVRRSVVAAAAGAPTTRDFNFLSPTPGAHFSQYPTGHNAPPPAQAILQPQVLRIKVGTLSPTPHHPKVVAMLKVPFPLPDVEVERMGVIKRRGFPMPGMPQSTEPPQVILPEDEDPNVPYTGITLTAEEIKDMVCSTGLWLVVREGFGGVGRVSRKGDGWRIRA